MSVRSVSVEVLHDRCDKSLVEELMADLLALWASFSDGFYQLGSKGNQQRLLDAVGQRLAR
jgi:hypothetical protein